MSKRISKELLREVLKERVVEVKDIRDSNLNYIIDVSTIWREELEYNINIYELGNKCKEWAWGRGFNLSLTRHSDDNICCKIDERNIESHGAKYADTEPEAIFKACEYILNVIKQ